MIPTQPSLLSRHQRPPHGPEGLLRGQQQGGRRGDGRADYQVPAIAAEQPL